MITDTLTNFKNFLHAQVSYYVFVTPHGLPLQKKYRNFARLACKYFEQERTQLLHYESPRHYVIHRFAPKHNKPAKKILIAHGWMSRAAYMTRLIHCLRQQGFDVYALDFPAHGDAKGMQLPWPDAASVLQQVLNHSGPFYAVIGHSFGGAMLLSALNFARKYSEWQINNEPERIVLLASPMRMRMPLTFMARQFKLSAKSYLLLRRIFRERTIGDLRHLSYRHYIEHTNIPILCIHGKDDKTIAPKDSINFCQKYPNASLTLLSGVDHYNILIDERVEKTVSEFLGTDENHFMLEAAEIIKPTNKIIYNRLLEIMGK